MLTLDVNDLIIRLLGEIKKYWDIVKELQVERDYLKSRLEGLENRKFEFYQTSKKAKNTLAILPEKDASNASQLILKGIRAGGEFYSVSYLILPKEFKLIDEPGNKDGRTLQRSEEVDAGLGVAPKNKPHTFITANLADVLESIAQNEPVEGILLKEKLRNPFFQFQTLDNPELSLKASRAISLIIRDSHRLDPSASQAGRDKQKVTADEYASNIFDLVVEAKAKGVKTFRATVDYLNENEIPTFRGGKWHIKTLQDLQKRWKNLGLTETKPSQP